MTRTELASMIDHTLLRPDAGPFDIETICGESIEYGFASVCINPIWVSYANSILNEAGPFVCSVVGFPLGATNCMAEETAGAVENGASEIDMVMPAGYLKNGDTLKVAEFIRGVVNAASGRPVKVIIETCLLTDHEKILACNIAMDNGAAWVKTSTGFGSAGAKAEDVALMHKAVNGRIGVKASGGIRTLEDALLMINAGAGRLGCSRSIDIVEALES